MSDAPAPFDRLTARELTVVRCIVDGDRNATIAQALQCSVKTVDTHRANALKKLNLRHNVDLTREAIRVGLVAIVDGGVHLTTGEAALALSGVGYWSSDYNDAPHDEINALRDRLRALGVR